MVRRHNRSRLSRLSTVTHKNFHDTASAVGPGRVRASRKQALRQPALLLCCGASTAAPGAPLAVSQSGACNTSTPPAIVSSLHAAILPTPRCSLKAVPSSARRPPASAAPTATPCPPPASMPSAKSQLHSSAARATAAAAPLMLAILQSGVAAGLQLVDQTHVACLHDLAGLTRIGQRGMRGGSFSGVER